MSGINYRGRLMRAVDDLNKLVRDAKAEHPEAELYLANDTLHLLSGPSHSDAASGKCKSHPERSLASATIYGSGGGDW